LRLGLGIQVKQQTHTLIQAHHPCHMTNSTSKAHVMSNCVSHMTNSTSKAHVMSNCVSNPADHNLFKNITLQIPNNLAINSKL